MDPFAAVADPVRRRIVEVLAVGPQPAGRLAAAFEDISRPAVSRHLRVLREAGLVDAEPAGRERIYRLLPASLDEVRTWLDDIEARVTTTAAAAGPFDHLTDRLDALDTEVRRTRRDRAPEPQPATTTHPTQERTA